MTCKAQRQGDEMFCAKCDRRWSIEDYVCHGTKRIVIGLSGPAGAGKSTVARMLVEQRGFVNIKFAGALKHMFGSLLSAAGVDDPVRYIEGDLKEVPCELLGGRTPRYAMQTLGTEWGRDVMSPDLWVAIVRARIDAVPADTPVVLDDVRFENEASMVRSMGGKIIEITGRGGIVGSHPSESGVLWDMQYRNVGTIPELLGWVDYVLPLTHAR